MTLALLADENFPLPVIRGIIEAGYDVLSVAQISPGISDRAMLSLARETGRCLLTFDVDFGDLVFSHGVEPLMAILYFRLYPIIVEELARLIALLENQGVKVSEYWSLVQYTIFAVQTRYEEGITELDEPIDRVTEIQNVRALLTQVEQAIASQGKTLG